MYNHFSKIAPHYRQVRTTDLDPIIYISETLKELHDVKAADIGCGAGRYDLLLFQHLSNLHLTCVDINEHMLEKVSDYLLGQGFNNYLTVRADANVLPLENNSMDFIFTFNAIHHFDFVKFLENSARALKGDGRTFIYTRLRSQNAGSIWGRYFPLFSEKETRLHELEEMKNWIHSTDSLSLETVRPFKYKRLCTLERLVEQVITRHYSTFSLYEENELDGAVETFQENIKKEFQNMNEIEWCDENILLVLRRD